MERFFRAVLTHRKIVLTLFVLATIAGALCIPLVNVNYQFADYLPKDSPSTIALEEMHTAFDTSIPNSRLYVKEMSVTEAEDLADDLLAIDGVDGVMWLGDIVDTRVPIDMIDEKTLSGWYADGGFLYQLTIDSSKAVKAIEDVRAVCAAFEEVDLAGEAVNTATAQGSSNTEIQLIMVMAIIVVFGLLLLTSEAWFEPVLFLAVVGVAIVLNMGTNIFKGEISFITQMCAAILQLAVSMDYGIVMLHTFRGLKEEGLEPFEAMAQAMRKAFSVIAASAATTLFGFLSLCFMAFLIGVDMGLVLAKGIIFSFGTVMILLPVLILIFQKPLQKTMHRKLLPSFDRFARICIRIAIPVSVIAVLSIVPAYLGQSRADFTYGASSFVEEGSQLFNETKAIDELFGASEQWVVMVPEGDWAEETALIDDLEAMPLVTSVTAYSTVASEAIPTAVVGEEELSQLISGGYSRIVVSTSIKGEGDIAFSLVEDVRAICAEHYGDTYHLVGASVTIYDMKATASGDTLRVILASIISIGLVLLVMFRSLSLPLILLLAIEISTWINLAIPYFIGSSIQYIGYLIVSAIQLGATVDYTIILTHAYLGYRKDMGPMDAIRKAISTSAITILTSGTILTLSGVFIKVISSNGVIAELGLLIGRGAGTSVVMTFLFLPVMLVVCDWIIRHTTLGLKLLKKPEGHHE
ncbi:MAG: MMPL family transporter [Actinobacteria bacterium]|nr:MMPL family transporter [Actinomycetota bacterium]